MIWIILHNLQGKPKYAVLLMVETNKQTKNSTECIPFPVSSVEIYSVKEQNFAA